MRVLFVSLPEKSHLYCMVPLAWAMTAAGHEVRVAAPPSFVPAVVGAGLTAVPLGSDGVIHDLAKQAPDSQDYPTSNWSRCEPGEVSWEEIRERYALSVPYGFALYNDHLLDDLVALAREWRPDLVVRDPLAFAAGVAAHVVGARQIRLLWSLDVWGRTRHTFHQLRAEDPGARTEDPLADWLAASAARHGADFDEVLVDGHATIDTMPPSLRLPSDLSTIPMRFVAHNGPAQVPEWVRRVPTRPRICLTLGTSNVEGYGADYVSVTSVLAALADLDVEVVAALVPAQQETVRAAGPLPDNARLIDPIALHVLLPTCAAIVHHGGYGSFATALAAGVPQLAISTSISDHERRGRALERAGAGRFLHHKAATPADVRAAVAELVTRPVTEAAAGLADEVAALSPPAAAVAGLAELAASVLV
ncbi:MAG TPA: activator-dependent family glycosyltransferase [Pseudonocardia sp.]|nr:activator-dependent family glycosyltransferase [Pseudonocardia sp.]